MRAAIYARVSTDRQERDQTIESQLSALKAWADQHGHELLPEHVFVDAGLSGARLDRPALDRLRDAAREGTFDVVAILCPDRLARKYAYQVLLLEEFRRAGCSVTFLHRPISDDPNDQLLLQIQGAVAEYERAVISERFRRGRLQKAREGQFLGGKAPYGYRYVPKSPALPGHLILDDTETALVQTVFRWLIDERMTIRQIIKRLNASAWRPRTGKPCWCPAAIHHVLSDPVYTGTAYVNKYRAIPPRKPRPSRDPRTPINSYRQLRPKDEWIPVLVPTLIDQETYDQAQAQLARNALLSFRNNTKHSYLLRCLLTCSTCRLAMFGRTQCATTTTPERRYYLCHGKDALLSAREVPCPRHMVKAEELESAVWTHVRQLLADPSQLLAQFQQFATASSEGTDRERAETRQLDQRIERLNREEQRLVDAYQAAIISLAELADRRQQIERRRHVLVEQRDQQRRLRHERAQAEEVLASVTAFCARIHGRLETVTFTEKQEILQLLIERIIVGEDTLEIRHVIPLSSVPGRDGEDPPNRTLRSDGVVPTALPPTFGPHRSQRCPDAQGAVADHEQRAAHAALAQIAQHAGPALGALPIAELERQQFLLPIGA
jgi:site-specific DNA recombinase